MTNEKTKETLPVTVSPPPETEGSRKISWFEATFPHWFTKKIVDHRNAPLSTEEHKDFYERLDCRVGNNKTNDLLLVLTPSTGKYRIKSVKYAWTPLPVEKSAILAAINPLQGGEWVRLSLGTQVVCINRTQLCGAFRRLEAKLKT